MSEGGLPFRRVIHSPCVPAGYTLRDGCCSAESIPSQDLECHSSFCKKRQKEPTAEANVSASLWPISLKASVTSTTSTTFTSELLQFMDHGGSVAMIDLSWRLPVLHRRRCFGVPDGMPCAFPSDPALLEHEFKVLSASAMGLFHMARVLVRERDREGGRGDRRKGCLGGFD